LGAVVRGNRVSPHPDPRGAGETGFPQPPTRWEGLGGRSPPKNKRMFITALCGGAAWTAEVNIGRERGPLAREDATRAGRLRSQARVSPQV